MLGKTVNFEGVAWPEVRVTGSQPLMMKFVGPSGMARPNPRTTFFDLVATGKPRPWSTNVTQGFWRTFIEACDSNDGARMAAFAARYGDPWGKLDADNEISTSDWFTLRVELGAIANAWGSEEDDSGVSRISRDRDRIDHAMGWLRFNGLKELAKLVTVIPDPTGAPDLALRANSLAGYLWASAVSALKRRVPMRRCRTCAAWFELLRSDALYCCNACRIAHHRSTKD